MVMAKLTIHLNLLSSRMMENGTMGKWSGVGNFYIEINNYIKDNFLMV